MYFRPCKKNPVRKNQKTGWIGYDSEELQQHNPVDLLSHAKTEYSGNPDDHSYDITIYKNKDKITISEGFSCRGTITL
jgi:hypothetical protein